MNNNVGSLSSRVFGAPEGERREIKEKSEEGQEEKLRFESPKLRQLLTIVFLACASVTGVVEPNQALSDGGTVEFQNYNARLQQSSAAVAKLEQQHKRIRTQIDENNRRIAMLQRLKLSPNDIKELGNLKALNSAASHEDSEIVREIDRLIGEISEIQARLNERSKVIEAGNSDIATMQQEDRVLDEKYKAACRQLKAEGKLTPDYKYTAKCDRLGVR